MFVEKGNASMSWYRAGESVGHSRKRGSSNLPWGSGTLQKRDNPLSSLLRGKAAKYRSIKETFQKSSSDAGCVFLE